MSNPFFDHPILNSPYARPARHWELDEHGQPTQRTIDTRRRTEFITPIPKPKKRKKASGQEILVFDEGKGLSTTEQQYDPTSIINEVRGYVETWRSLPNPSQWQVTPETARLLQHWRHHKFSEVRPFFCQVEAVETAIWLTEVAPQSKNGKRLLDHLASANRDANPELMRLALKLATGAGKTTVMAMIIAWQTVNAVRRPRASNSRADFWCVRPALRSRTGCAFSSPTIPTTTTTIASSSPATCSKMSNARRSSSLITTRSNCVSASPTKAARIACPVQLARIAGDKLDRIGDAMRLEDLRIPPGNHLEALKGNRAGQHSIRINDRYRICFTWAENGRGRRDR